MVALNMARYPEMAGKAALIAGGATMIGARVATALAEQGVRSIIADIDVAGGNAAAASLGDAGLFVETDITSDDAIDKCITAGIARFGRIDYLINVATSYLDDGIATSRETWLRAFDIGLVGGAMLAQRLKDQLASNRGAIVNFSSISAHRAQTGRFVYPAIKAATAQLTRSQALEFAPLGVRVNAVTPGWTWSNIISVLSNGDRARADEVGGPFHLAGRIGDARDVAKVVVFLCSPDAALVQGAEIAADGGYLALGPEGTSNAIAQLVN